MSYPTDLTPEQRVCALALLAEEPRPSLRPVQVFNLICAIGLGLFAIAGFAYNFEFRLPLLLASFVSLGVAGLLLSRHVLLMYMAGAFHLFATILLGVFLAGAIMLMPHILRPSAAFTLAGMAGIAGLLGAHLAACFRIARRVDVENQIEMQMKRLLGRPSRVTPPEELPEVAPGWDEATKP